MSREFAVKIKFEATIPYAENGCSQIAADFETMVESPDNSVMDAYIRAAKRITCMLPEGSTLENVISIAVGPPE